MQYHHMIMMHGIHFLKVFDALYTSLVTPFHQSLTSQSLYIRSLMRTLQHSIHPEIIKRTCHQYSLYLIKSKRMLVDAIIDHHKPT